MDFKEWIGKSSEMEFTLNPETFRSYQEQMDTDGSFTDEGDLLPPFGYWFYVADQDNGSFNDIFKDSGDLNIYWRSGKISVNTPLVVGRDCKSVLKIKDVESLSEEDQSFLITLSQRVLTGRSAAIEEELQVVAAGNSGNQQKRHRIDFDPDWELEIDQNRAEKYLTLEPRIFGRPAPDILSGLGEQEKQSAGPSIQGPPGMILLLETFSENFGSRKIESLNYRSYGVENVDSLTIACRDTDTYQTSMRLINSRRQVFFSTEIQWNYAW
ncbi:MAG TPA: hypothetical protein VKM36_07260 [Balneolaceae bacterium]|nr:hypothetical protein [Balneolaceae bacterium]